MLFVPFSYLLSFLIYFIFVFMVIKSDSGVILGFNLMWGVICVAPRESGPGIHTQ